LLSFEEYIKTQANTTKQIYSVTQNEISDYIKSQSDELKDKYQSELDFKKKVLED